MWVELAMDAPWACPRPGSPACCTAPPDREAVALSPERLHWEALDKDISIAGLLAGRGDVAGARVAAA